MAQPLRTTSPSPPRLLKEYVSQIAVLTLNRPAARNSLSEELIADLHAALRAIAEDPSVRAVVIAASGTAFSSGHDLKQLTAHRTDTDRGRAYFAHTMSICSAMMQAIVQLPKPVIAAVQGVATAAGCQLVASCDLAVASETAQFSTPGVHIGLFCSTPMVALSRNVSNKHAMEMLLTGDMVTAQDAYRIGLVNRVVPPGQATERALELARQIAAKSMLTVKLGKEAFYRQREMNLADAYKLTIDVMVDNMLARDAEEGIGAFIETREPDWENR